MPVVGTAGHVDHGKSTLVRRLTGRDPDRWAEEKRRGLTIDLGFAWTVLPGGTEVSFVDVPGHRRFAKNMLAGVEAVDIALLVVAADEGWMPQSEEHLAVLDLLEIDRGVIALTKMDLVAGDLRELARLETLERLEGSHLEDAVMVAVSSTTGEGIDELGAELGRLASEVTVPDRARPRLWVDRVFTASGAGLVVTGTLLEGSVSTGDLLTVHPAGIDARVRSIQSHETVSETVGPGRRVALNLAGIDRTDVGRGDMIGIGDQWRPTKRFAVSLRPARYAEAVERRGAYQIHVGSGAYPVAITGLDAGVAVMTTEIALPLIVGDRFIIRDTGRRMVVAGGRVLDPNPGPTRSALTATRKVDPSRSSDLIATTLLDIRQTASHRSLSVDSGGGSPLQGDRVGDTWFAPGLLDGLEKKAYQLLSWEHQHRPLRIGIPISTLANRLGVAQEVLGHVIDASKRIERRDADVSLAGRVIPITPEQATERARIRERLAESLEVPTVEELGVEPELLHLMAREGEVVKVSQDLVILPEQADEIRETVTGLPGGFTIADFRQRTGLSRKYSVPFLEWCDAIGLTVRRGDSRWVR